MKRALTTILAFACVAFLAADVQAQKSAQTEEEFQQLMPISGKVETYFGDFRLDHSFPAAGEAQRIYDLMDRQRAAQLYLGGVPLVGMTRWHEAYKQN